MTESYYVSSVHVLWNFWKNNCEIDRSTDGSNFRIQFPIFSTHVQFTFVPIYFPRFLHNRRHGSLIKKKQQAPWLVSKLSLISSPFSLFYDIDCFVQWNFERVQLPKRCNEKEICSLFLLDEMNAYQRPCERISTSLDFHTSTESLKKFLTFLFLTVL